jgi:integrase
MGLTKRSIDALKWNPKGPSAQILWDGDLPGYGVRVFDTGAKAFIIDYRDKDARKRRVTIGRYGVLTPDQARDKAKGLLGDIAMKGANPAEDRRAKRETLTFHQFESIYIEQAKTVGNPGRRERRPKKTWGEDKRRIKKYIRPAFGGRTLSSITKTDVVRLHKKIGKDAPVEANRVLALLSVMFTSAIEAGHLPETFANPTHGVTPFAEKDRDRWVQPHELPALWNAIQAESNPYIRAFFVLALLLGTRRSELLKARWENVDLERGIIRLPNTKAGNDHDLPLPPQAVAILKDLPRMLGNPHVFPSPLPTECGKPMRDVKRQWKRIRETASIDLWTAANPKRAAELQAKAGDNAEQRRALILGDMHATGAKPFDIRLHDLRRTVGSWLALSGNSLQLIGKVLNHADVSTTQIYARLHQDATRAALEQHAAHLLAVATDSIVA